MYICSVISIAWRCLQPFILLERINLFIPCISPCLYTGYVPYWQKYASRSHYMFINWLSRWLVEEMVVGVTGSNCQMGSRSWHFKAWHYRIFLRKPGDISSCVWGDKSDILKKKKNNYVFLCFSEGLNLTRAYHSIATREKLKNGTWTNKVVTKTPWT